ncbi:hypothetical protein ACJZ2D_007014 [Fusarium nematophilum]
MDGASRSTIHQPRHPLEANRRRLFFYLSLLTGLNGLADVSDFFRLSRLEPETLGEFTASHLYNGQWQWRFLSASSPHLIGRHEGVKTRSQNREHFGMDGDRQGQPAVSMVKLFVPRLSLTRLWNALLFLATISFLLLFLVPVPGSWPGHATTTVLTSSTLDPGPSKTLLQKPGPASASLASRQLSRANQDPLDRPPIRHSFGGGGVSAA